MSSQATSVVITEPSSGPESVESNVKNKWSRRFGGSASTLDGGKFSNQSATPNCLKANDDSSSYFRRHSVGADPVIESSRALRKFSEALGMQ